MAYVALTNLRNTIRCLNKFSRLSELPYSFDTIDYPYEEIEFLEKVIRKLDERSRNGRVKAFYEKIREAANGVEDVIESVLSDLILIAQSEQSIGNMDPWVYEEEVKEGLNSFIETAKNMKEEYSNELEYLLPGDEEDDDDEDEDSSFGRKKPKLVGSNCKVLITKIKDQVNRGYKSCELRVVSVVGLAGSGRSTFAWTLFHDKSASSLHKLRALVCVGPKYEFKEILLSILSQIDSSNGHKLLDFEGEEKIFEYLHTILKGGDYLIVLDDVQETRVWEYLRKLFPNENNGSRVVLTTHLKEVAVFAQSFSIHPMHVLHSEESWNVISGVLFPNQERCPPKLEKVGKKIAKNCKGLLFEVGRYAEILSEVDKTPEHWNNVAAEMVINSVAYDEMSEISKMMGDDYSILRPCDLPGIMMEALDFTDATYGIWENVYIFPSYVVVGGMAGIGKTAVAQEVFEDPWIMGSYDHRVWITIGPKYEFKRILVDILAQLDPNVDKIHTEDDETLIKHISSILSSKRCFMVLDDVWEKDHRSYLSELLQVIKCEVLLTTRLWGVAWDYFGESNCDSVHEMQLLNEEESWSLLRDGVFGEESWPRELEKPGKLIAENCEGLPLMIVTVASLLSKADDRTPEYWNEVAKNKNCVFEQAYLKISKVLYPSYKDLDIEVRACFLYMAAFRVKYDIPISKLFMLQNVEGIIPSGSWNINKYKDYLKDLVGKSLVLTRFTNKYNTCRLHSVFWHFCVREARNDMFFYIQNSREDVLAEDIVKQRRLCVQSTVLFAIKYVHDSMASVSAARSLLCFGPPHPYQVPMCLESKFIKVLDALSIRFYELPVGIFKLVLLRYLALTYNGELPTSISRLWSLEFLIIHEHISIRFPGYVSYLPIEIWEMKELQYLNIMGRNLPDPPSSSNAILDRLSSVVDLRAENVTKTILERIPNLVYLGICIELAPNHVSEPMFSFDPISYLKRLDFLHCAILNPELKSVVVAAPAPFSILPSSLRILTLSGFGYPWEHIRPISLLPNLQELQLECYAFQGAEWVMHEGDFKNLRSLLVEDTDLVDWRADDFCHLISLEKLFIGHGHKLKQIPWHSLPRSCKTELVDCNPSAWEKMPENDCQIICSWLQGGKI